MRVTVDGVEAELWAGTAPFTARPASDKSSDWPFWYVTDDGRRNVLRFPGKPGAVFTSRDIAEKIAAAANG